MGPVYSAVAAYLVGCVPAARLVSRAAQGKSWEPVAERAADFLKGFIALAIFAANLNSVGQALCLTALTAGDQWPAIGADRGRLGLWTAAGGMTFLTPIAPLIWGVLWSIGFVASGYLVWGRVVALATFWIALGFVAGWPLGLMGLPASLMVLERSRDDVARVRHGGEPKHHWRADS